VIVLERPGHNDKKGSPEYCVGKIRPEILIMIVAINTYAREFFLENATADGADCAN